MDLYEIQHNLIAGRGAEAWFRVDPAEPSFHDWWTRDPSDPVDGRPVVWTHHSHAVCREQPGLTMSWGMDAYDPETLAELQFDWLTSAASIVNKHMRPFWVDFFWNNALVDRVELVSIDGAHGLVPRPTIDRTITDFELAVAHLIHGFTGSSIDQDPTAYLGQLGLKAVYDDARHGAGAPRRRDVHG